MKLDVELAGVATCDVRRCAYNVRGDCHARAITVGDGLHPGCDTFLESERHPPADTPTAGVGACKVVLCRHNRDLECEARAIRVGVDQGEAACLTFDSVA